VKPDIVQDYVATGQVYLEYRHFPFLGDESVRAAEASMCAADQGEFWRYHETVFLNLQSPPRDQGGYSQSRLQEMGEMIGLDMDEFEQCVSDREHQSDVEAMRNEAGTAGITGTPQFQVNGQRLELENYDQLRAAIDAELNSE
jgi:protein-disulfide isomerase